MLHKARKPFKNKCSFTFLNYNLGQQPISTYYCIFWLRDMMTTEVWNTGSEQVVKRMWNLWSIGGTKTGRKAETEAPWLKVEPSKGYSNFAVDPDTHQFSSVQFSHSVMSNSLQPHELQHARPPCPSPTPGVYPNPCPLSW